jgi:hypothetical protein
LRVFGRKPDFDSKHDPIVRTEAGRLRARLSEYYRNGGRSDPLIIEMPKGGYAPVFRELQSTAAIAPEQMKTGAQPGRFRRQVAVAVAYVCAAAAGALIWHAGRQSTPIPIAVLPLEKSRP